MTGIHAKARPIIGQEAVVPNYGLGRVEHFDEKTVTVRSHVTGTARVYDAANVRLVDVGELRDAGDWL